LSGLALFRLQVDMADPEALRPYLMIDAMVILVAGFAARSGDPTLMPRPAMPA